MRNISRQLAAACGLAPRGRRQILAFALVASVSLLAAGCEQRIDTLYGQRKGFGATGSVNGTAVLGEMFQQAGHRVFSWRRLSPRLHERTDCIVWVPDDFGPPSPEVCRWLDEWLEDEPARTLIYVGRDFDAAVWYWEQIRPDAPADQQAEIRRRLVEAKSDLGTRRRKIPASEDCDWFTLQRKNNPRKVRTLAGEPAWSKDVDPAKLRIEIRHRLLPAPDAEVLLESEGDMLISRRQYYESQLIVVANGSFLLNLPLVNHEHRKLAGKLVELVGEPEKTVVFLESRPAGPVISDNDPLAGIPSGAEIFNLWPTNWILLHLAAVGIIFCCWRFPIFGRPREPQADSPSDFGKHILATAALLKQSEDQVYARTQLMHYRQTTSQ